MAKRRRPQFKVKQTTCCSNDLKTTTCTCCRNDLRATTCTCCGDDLKVTTCTCCRNDLKATTCCSNATLLYRIIRQAFEIQMSLVVYATSSSSLTLALGLGEPYLLLVVTHLHSSKPSASKQVVSLN